MKKSLVVFQMKTTCLIETESKKKNAEGLGCTVTCGWMGMRPVGIQEVVTSIPNKKKFTVKQSSFQLQGNSCGSDKIQMKVQTASRTFTKPTHKYQAHKQ